MGEVDGAASANAQTGPLWVRSKRNVNSACRSRLAFNARGPSDSRVAFVELPPEPWEHLHGPCCCNHSQRMACSAPRRTWACALIVSLTHSIVPALTGDDPLEQLIERDARLLHAPISSPARASGRTNYPSASRSVYTQGLAEEDACSGPCAAAPPRRRTLVRNMLQQQSTAQIKVQRR